MVHVAPGPGSAGQVLPALRGAAKAQHEAIHLRRRGEVTTGRDGRRLRAARRSACQGLPGQPAEVIFLDTSAIYALADVGDPNHELGRSRLASIVEDGVRLLTHNYVLVESMALLQNRLGLEAT